MVVSEITLVTLWQTHSLLLKMAIYSVSTNKMVIFHSYLSLPEVTLCVFHVRFVAELVFPTPVREAQSDMTKPSCTDPQRYSDLSVSCWSMFKTTPFGCWSFRFEFLSILEDLSLPTSLSSFPDMEFFDDDQWCENIWTLTTERLGGKTQSSPSGQLT